MGELKEGSYSASGTLRQSAAEQLYARTNHHKQSHTHYETDDGIEQSTSITCACGWSIETTTEDEAQAAFNKHQVLLRRRFLP